MCKISSFLKNFYISKIKFISKDSGLQLCFYIRLKCECIILCILFCFCATSWKTSTSFYLNLTVTRKQFFKFSFLILTSTYINKFRSIFKLSVPLFLRNLIGGAFPVRKLFYGYFFSYGNSIRNHQGKSKARWRWQQKLKSMLCLHLR